MKATKAKSRPPTKKSTSTTPPPKRGKADALLDELARAATEVRERAYAPYSRYRVGAAIATKSGRIFTGCNVENATFGATICAERGAVMQMIAAGERDPVACAVVTGDGGSPCGICRQVLAEFARDMPIALIAAKDADEQTGLVVRLAELLPLAFALRPKA